MTNTSNIRKVKSVVLLLVFVLLKMGIAHEISHAFSHDEIADCEDCFLMLDANEKNLFNYQSQVYEENALIVSCAHKPILLLYKNPMIDEFYSYEFFNKPPPNLV